MPQLTDRQDAEIARYRTLSSPAVGALILGLASPLAIIDPLLWCVPFLGIAVGGWALWRIAWSAPAQIGRKAALLGLTLSVFFGTAAVADWFVYREMICHQARQFAARWFEFLAHGQPREAHQLTINPLLRQPPQQGLQDVYREDTELKRQLDGYVAEALIAKLLKLGEKARVRYDKTVAQGHTGELDVLGQRFAVTSDDEETGEEVTFFVTVVIERLRLDTGQIGWQIVGVRGDVSPEGG